MRIIVGHDYYDRALAHGRDESIVFVRARAEFLEAKVAAAAGVLLPAPPAISIKTGRRDWERVSFDSHRGPSRTLHIRSPRDNIDVSRIVVWVCGTRYAGLEVRSWPRSDLAKHRFLWTREAFDTWIAEEGHVMMPVGHWSEMHDTPLETYFEPVKAAGQCLDTLIARRITVLTWCQGIENGEVSPWRVNGDDLRSLEFYRVMDAATIFQEISMWVGGVLPAAGNRMVEITDNKVKAAKHGFDEWSFRRQPAGRRASKAA